MKADVSILLMFVYLESFFRFFVLNSFIGGRMATDFLRKFSVPYSTILFNPAN